MKLKQNKITAFSIRQLLIRNKITHVFVKTGCESKPGVQRSFFGYHKTPVKAIAKSISWRLKLIVSNSFICYLT